MTIYQEKTLPDVNNSAPELTKKILTKKVLSANFEQEESINNSIKVISSQFLSLNTSGFNGKQRQDLIEDPMLQDEFLDMILEKIEELKEIESSIFEKALKIVMCRFLKESQFELYSFAQLLFYEVVYQTLITDLHDNLKDIFEELEYNLIEKMVRQATNQIMNESVFRKVNLFIEKKISLNDVLSEIATQTSEAKFGEF
ncbi:hypothetical protein M4D48_15190 [Alkalihalobacillus clausii]|uniref:hypothetical protein n=1 Tax=Shouchella clausii TaxID=79880 RepID=UPI00203CFB52|nr:hypothetical protein [Shouchella clausii]MCM3549921.1 hypothetical protein [Shouchella clausii]